MSSANGSGLLICVKNLYPINHAANPHTRKQVVSMLVCFANVAPNASLEKMSLTRVLILSNSSLSVRLVIEADVEASLHDCDEATHAFISSRQRRHAYSSSSGSVMSESSRSC